MPPIIYGLYEQVINRIVHIDSAESSKILAEYLARILGEVLDYIGDGENDLKDRVDLCNSIIMHIVECIEKGNYGLKSDSILTKRIRNLFIEQDAKLLLALVDRRKQADLHGVRPETSIAENSLFTGAAHEPSMVSRLRKKS